MKNDSSNKNTGRTTTNLLLAGACTLLAFNLVRGGGGIDSVANANRGESGLVSAAEQRKQIVTELRGLKQHISQLEQRLSSGINVKVTEMPRVVERGE